MVQQLTRYRKEIALNLFAVFMITVIPARYNAASAANIKKLTDNLYSGPAVKNSFDSKIQSRKFLFSEASASSLNQRPPLFAGILPGKEMNRTVEADRPEKSDKEFIGGPGQPEMSAFKSVNADNIVDLFSGDFSYNIPLMDVGGYPVNLFYNGGITMDQQASWVGLGFNINPGTIMRNMRGLPDDFDGTDIITKTQSIRPDQTWGVNAGASVEIIGLDVLGASLAVNAGLSFNNQRGIALEMGVNPSISLSAKAGDDKTASLSFGANLNVNSQSGATFTPSVGLSLSNKDAVSGSLTASLGYHSRMGLQSLHLDAELSKSKTIQKNSESQPKNYHGSIYTHSSSISFAYPAVTPSIRTILTRKNFNVKIKLGGEATVVHPNGSIGGFYSETRIKDADKVTAHPAYGMLYYQKANNDKKAMLDFNRLNDGAFTKNSPTIAIPVYTYDVFSISGEGVGGSFRAYRGDLGYIRDEETKTRDEAGTLGLEIGGGNVVHGGVNLEYVFTPSTVGAWNKNNLAKNSFEFKKSEGTYQSVYFKNPGEKAIPDINYQNAIGGEDLVRLKMMGQGTGTPSLLPTLEKFNDTKYKTGDLPLASTGVIKNRDKRTQVITCFTSEEAARIGFDKKIYSYDPAQPGTIFGRCDGAGIKPIIRYTGYKGYTGTDNYRNQNHISEIDVLGEDGRKYVYGLPVYNTKQVDATFNVNNGDASTQQSTYDAGTDDTKDNQKGKDWFVEKESMPAYTHSFLLTALVSPNYVDVKGDGITEDDMGDAIKFNYSQFEKGYRWRTPVGNGIATWNEGMKTDNKDDKGHYTYGEREMWYLYSIESKNMVARFYVANDRKDDKEVVDSTGEIDLNWGSQRLTKISLFSKADLLKSNPKPIKTVYFEYSYKLCKGVPGSIGSAGAGDNGKLTLENIYFSYNGNEKQRKNRYRFSYAQNPNYDFSANDRWGSYKPKANNPPGLSNSDYPYAVQSKATADQNAAAWTLSNITLPSGGKIDVEFETDDYAYVQDRKACSMYEIIGFGKKYDPSAAEQTNNTLYTKDEEFDYIYIKVPYAITSSGAEQQREIAARYFNSKSNQLFMKLAVPMPSEPGIPGSEFIPMYADIINYGVIPGTNGGKIFIKVQRMESGSTPMVQYALQFIKNYLPFKAFPGYDVSDAGGLRSVMMALAGMCHNLGALVNGEDRMLKAEKKCKIVDVAKSFVRLTNPYFTRYGGGYRVKKVTLRDNWNKLSGGYDATYGQQYIYATTELINGTVTPISSGVASWEPSIGGEENPHREILRYLNKNKGGPFDYGSVELPLAEMFFPSASVGYSRVEVLSIHKDAVKNAPGKTVTEYYTTKDFPTKSDYTSLADGTANVQYKPRPIMQLLKMDLKQSITVSQGFKVTLNDMNGKLKSQAAYSAGDAVNPVSYTQNFYNVNKATDNTYQFNHNFQTLASANGFVSQNVIGREIEVMTDFREHKTETITTNINFNLDFFQLGILPIAIPALFSPTFYESNTFRSAAMLKVVNHYSILDSVVSIDKGSMVSTKNLIYDAETGNALVSRTNNEHNKPQYSFSYPAHWAYPGMGPAYKNIDAIYEGLVFRNGLLETPIDMSVFESGDEIYVFSELTRGPAKNALCDGSIAGTYLPKNTENKIWAVYTGKVGSLTPQFAFIDKDGNPYTADNVKMRIIRSGKRNLLDQGVGGVTTLNNPVRQIAGFIKKIVLDDETAILQTTAASFKDHWRVDNVMYEKQSFVTTTVDARIKKVELRPIDYINTYLHQKTTDDPEFDAHKDDFLALTKRSRTGNIGHHSEKWYQRSHILFDYSTVPSTAVFYAAFLSLYSHLIYFPIGTTPVDHRGLHTGNASQTRAVLGEIKLMKSNWFATNDATSWGNTYLITNQYLSTASGLMPGSVTGTEAYTLYNSGRFNISSAVAGNAGTPLGLTGKIGLQLRLFNDAEIDGGNLKFRCFWSTSSPSKTFTPPVLDYYYYNCGDMSMAYNDYMDPYVNSIVHCYSYNTPATFCLSKFNQRKSMNPYVEGIWGNWRVDTSFVYYGDRKETDPGVPVDTRKGGVINNFKSFWNFSALLPGLPLVRNFSASDVWVWNSTITQYNRKGYEIENKDALGRFNAGLYGYNQQLPVAVANNSRYREIMFDGFEDYDYQSASCTENCKPRRHVVVDNVAGKIDAAEKHSGRYSLRVDAGTSASFSAPVTSEAEADKPYWMRVRVDSSSYQVTTVTLTGTGLRGKYLKFSSSTNNSAMLAAATTAIANINSSPSTITRTDAQINLQYHGSMQPPTGWGKFVARWDGSIQSTVSGVHYFRTTSNDGIKVWINGNLIINNWTAHGEEQNNATFSFTAGQAYPIVIEYFDGYAGGTAQLLWKTPQMQSYNLVPQNAMYPPGATIGSVVTNTFWCPKLDSVQVRGNALTDSFSLIKGRKMVVSAWVKEGGNDCKCLNYVNNSIGVSFTGAANTYNMKPSGSIIEGWQRYEGVIDIPQAATKITVAMNNTTNVPVYFDDLRLHPFNANMKSFVYHSSSLRLMSEMDENNYASFYEYDDDGTLIRVKKETERGVKTITETRSSLQKTEL